MPSSLNTNQFKGGMSSMPMGAQPLPRRIGTSSGGMSPLPRKVGTSSGSSLKPMPFKSGSTGSIGGMGR